MHGPFAPEHASLLATWGQSAAALSAGDESDGDLFGSAVALSGTTTLVGAPYHGGTAGAAYLDEADGGGTLTVSPGAAVVGSSNTLTFTYTAAAGGTSSGGIAVVIPSGWSAPAVTPSSPGFTTSTCGAVGTSSQTIDVTLVTLAASATCTMTYGSTASSGPGARAPSAPTTSTFSASEESSARGNLVTLATSPVVDINKAGTTTAVTSSVNPSVSGQLVTFTATVSPVFPGTGTPTGTVTFLDGGSPIGTGTLSGGVATFATSALAVSNHTITTSYGGDGNFNGSTGSLTGNPQVVNKAATTTAVTSSVNPSVFGQSVTFTTTVSATSPGAGTPTGTVTFLDSGSPIGSGTLSGGVATFATVALVVGNHTITTSYGGDGNVTGSTGSLTGNPQVVSKANTATAVTSSTNPSGLGQSVTFTATVTPVAPGAGTPTGTVTFLDGGSPIGVGTLSGGVATLATSALAAGNHTITTSYGGDGNVNGSTGSLTGNPQVVSKGNTATAVTGPLNPSVFGQSVTLTVAVTTLAPDVPTGTVTFLDNSSPIGTGTLSGGVATLATSALAAGSNTITTSYGGDGNFNGSTGSLTGNPQLVNQANTTTALTSSLNSSNLGGPVTFTATLTAVTPASGSPTGTVTFLDGGSAIGTGTLSAGVATLTTSALAVR